MSKLILGIIVAAVIIGLFVTILVLDPEDAISKNDEVKVNQEIKKLSSMQESDSLIKFASYNDVQEFLSEAVIQNERLNGGFRGGGVFMFNDGLVLERRAVQTTSEPVPSPAPSPGAPPPMVEPQAGQDESSDGYGTGQVDFSKTNVQVENVDEPDFIKTDGKYLYVLSQNSLTIVDAYPSESAKVILKVALDVEQQNLENMFLNGNNLVIFYHGSGDTMGIAEYDYIPQRIYTPKTITTIIDVSDKENPTILNTYEIDGYYHNSRMINDTVYLLTTSGVDYYNPIIPRITTEDAIFAPDVYRFPNPEPNYNFNTVSAFSVSGDLINSESFLMGHSNTIFVSEDNLFITYQKNLPHTYYETMQKDRFFLVVVPLLPQSAQDEIKSIQDSDADSFSKWNLIEKVLQNTYNTMSKDQKDKLYDRINKAIAEFDSKIREDTQKTEIHKIHLNDGNLEYIANGQVPGYPLNQFSMDEHNGKFRIATTSNSFSVRESITSNNVYVLDESLNTIGKLEKIAENERIFSARFMGDKLFLVTFEQIDPFFVIDLSTNTPKILGELKIPGFSNYLQPYDKDTIIGFGRDTKVNQWGGVQTLGVKVSLFDVSDLKNPKEIDTILIGDGSTDSEALYNHKSLLLDKGKNIMSIPIKGNVDAIVGSSIRAPEYKTWNGFYVYGFDSKGFKEKGTIVHFEGTSYNYSYMPARSFYIENTLYTVMDGSIKMNDINDLSEKKSIHIAQTGKIIPFMK